MKCVVQLVFIILVFPVFATTTVTVQDKALTFSDSPRLTDILPFVRDASDIYWPAAALFEHSEEVLQLQHKVVFDLLQLADVSLNDELTTSAKALSAEIRQWHIAKRTPISIQFERAKLIPALNPKLKSGVFYLRLPKRIEQLYIYGAANTATVPFVYKQAIAAIFSEYSTSAAEKDYLWVIAADGSAKKVGVAYWNHEHETTRPNQQLFIPFAANQLPGYLSDLNDNIVTLLRHRMITE